MTIDNCADIGCKIMLVQNQSKYKIKKAEYNTLPAWRTRNPTSHNKPNTQVVWFLYERFIHQQNDQQIRKRYQECHDNETVSFFSFGLHDHLMDKLDTLLLLQTLCHL
jgi:hypothetical protein